MKISLILQAVEKTTPENIAVVHAVDVTHLLSGTDPVRYVCRRKNVNPPQVLYCTVQYTEHGHSLLL